MSEAVFHAHVYFTKVTAKLASELRERAQKELQGVLGISRLIDHPVGPHPLPMFEIDFYQKDFGNVLDWLYRNRNGLSVLVHKDVSPETPEHTVNAVWLGEQVKLDLSKLDLGTHTVHNQIMKK